MNVKTLEEAVHDSGTIGAGTLQKATMDIGSYKGRQDKECKIRDRGTESVRNRNGSPR